MKNIGASISVFFSLSKKEHVPCGNSHVIQETILSDSERGWNRKYSTDTNTVYE